MFTKSITVAVAMATLAVTAGPAAAQKSKDNVRIAFFQPVRVIDGIFDPRPEGGLLSRVVYDHLIGFDATTRKLVPLLAESWKQATPTTLELKLRRDVKFHDGSEFDADDVVYTIGMAIDPKVNFRFKGSRFGWIKSIEKVDKYTVRIHSKGVTSTGLARLTTQPPIYPSDYHKQFKVKSEFGKKPIGTGPFKVKTLNPAKGQVVLERNENYKHGGSTKPAAQVKTITVSVIPDKQTQVANILTGNVDMIYAVGNDLAKDLSNQPNFEIAVTPSVAFSYVQFDVRDRSKIGVFKDKRVREALLRAIDRKGLVQALQPKLVHNDPLQQAMCHPWHTACDSSVAPVSYDPAMAKRLLAEAGHANGFKVEITSWGPSVPIAEAIAGQWRKIGIQASVDALPIIGFIKKRAQGKIQANVTLWDNGVAQPDVDTTAGFFFLPGSRDMYGDKALADAVIAGRRELDIEKRKAIYRKAFDRVTTERYAMPVVPLPAIVIHDKNLEVQRNHKNPKGFEFNRLRWK